MAVKNVVILGSTGTIGINALNVIRHLSQKFRVIGLTAYNNVALLKEQIQRFKPRYIAASQAHCKSIENGYKKNNLKVLSVEKDLDDLVALKDVDIVVVGMGGSAALKPFLSAVRAGKRVAPANKEALVMAGTLLMREAKRCGATIVPIDSEQSAIFQCLDGQRHDDLKKIYLTASGGALLNMPRSKFDQLSVGEILKHPRWRMGHKITVDSATLMNKGFEIIEALRLFHLSIDQIEVVVHPEAIIHSMVEFKDGSILAQLGITDMRLPIQYALTYPERIKTNLDRLDFFKLKRLTFQRPDLKRFPSLALAFYVAKKDGTLPAVLNAADEVAVQAFLREKIPFSRIYNIVEQVVLRHKVKKQPNLPEIWQADQWARQEAERMIG